MMGSLETSTKIGFIGLGAMGLGMATDLQRRPQYTVTGFDIWQPSLDKFVARGGHAAKSPSDVAQSSKILICMAATAQQLDSILFDSSAVESLPKDATVVLSSTVPPTYYDTLPSRIASIGRPDVAIVDAPVSGGTLRAANGSLSIFAAGSDDALARAVSLLDDMSGQLYIISGGLGAASKIKMVNQLLVGTHIAAASEAIGFAAKAGLDTREVFDIIQHTSGSSWAWGNRVPHMLDQDWTPLSALNIFVKDMGIVVSTARATQFPLPVASVAEQLWISASAKGYGKEDDAGLVRIFLQGAENPKTTEQLSPIDPSELVDSTTAKIAVLGLDDLGRDLAVSLANSGFNVHIYNDDDNKIANVLSRTDSILVHKTPIATLEGADVLVLRVENFNEATDLLYGTSNAAEALASNAVVLLISTASRSQVKSLEKRLADLGTGISLIDAPVCYGDSSKESRSTTMLYSGSDTAIRGASGILAAVENTFNIVRHVSGGPGAASTVKLIDQMLSGIQILAAAEAMAFASHLGLSTSQIFHFVRSAAAWSWMLETRVPIMLEGAWTLSSELETGTGYPLSTFVRDLGIGLDEAKELMFWAPMTSAAHNVFLAAGLKGWGEEADAGVVKIYQTDSVSVAGSA